MSETKIEICPGRKMAVIVQADLPNTTHIIASIARAPQVGKVIALGESKISPKFKVGDLVAYRQFGEYEFFINGETVYFVKFEDILGVFNIKKNCCKD